MSLPAAVSPEEAGPPAAAGSCCLSADYRSAAVLGRLIARRRQHGRLLTARRPEWRNIENIDGQDQAVLLRLEVLTGRSCGAFLGTTRLPHKGNTKPPLLSKLCLHLLLKVFSQRHMPISFP